ncbi:hypothetical protein [Kitasatospora griseola]|uniref:hypothetical protein n=1 Tax=Kitasatospora griseola TaxID=2064 RepID=UPI0034330A1C
MPLTSPRLTTADQPRPPTGGARWLLTGQSAVDCAPAWCSPHGLAPIRVGARTGWNAIRVQTRLGEHALRNLLAEPTALGPVLDTGANLVFLVPTLHHSWPVLLHGTADTPTGTWNWGATLTQHLGLGHVLHCPQPGIPRRKGPRWLVEPDGHGALTLTGRLAEALHSAYRAVIAPALAEFAEPPQSRTQQRPANPANFAAFARRRPSTAEAS